MSESKPVKKPQLKSSPIVREIPLACSNELAAVEFLEKQRWDGIPACVHCGSVAVYKMIDAKTGERNKRFLWRCRDCKKQFTVRIGTVYEESRLPLRHWCYAFWRAATSKKGVSALEIKRQCQISYQSALFLMNRIRFAMAPDHETSPKLTGVVEADETYVGGKPRYPTPSRPGYRHFDTPEERAKYPSQRKPKPVVFAAVQRGGEVRVKAIANVTTHTLKAAVNQMVEKSAHLMTDEAPQYIKIGKEYAAHDRIRHSSRQYVKGDVTTNTIESFFAIFKRGLHGVYHNISEEHLHRYLAEFEFRYNCRMLNDGDRTVKAIQAAEGKRLMFKAPKAS